MEFTDSTAAVTPNRIVRWLVAVLLASVVALESGCALNRRCGTCTATRSTFNYRRCEQCRDLIATRAWNNYDCHGFEPTVWEPWPYDCPAVVVVPAEEVVPTATHVDVLSTHQNNQDAGGEIRHAFLATEASDREPDIEGTPVASPTDEPPEPPLPPEPPEPPLPPLPPEPRVEYESDLHLSKITELEPVQLVAYKGSAEAANHPIKFVDPIDEMVARFTEQTSAEEVVTDHRRCGRSTLPSSEVESTRCESTPETPKLDVGWDPPFFDPTLTRERLEISSRRNR